MTFSRQSANVPMAALILLGCLAIAGCMDGQAAPPYQVTGGGNAAAGRRIIEAKGCGACHTIPGIYTAHGLVGPPLYFFSRRTMIAGELPNSPANLARWIKDPKSVEPNTDMPDLGLTDEEARDVTAYLYTLR